MNAPSSSAGIPPAQVRSLTIGGLARSTGRIGRVGSPTAGYKNSLCQRLAAVPSPPVSDQGLRYSRVPRAADAGKLDHGKGAEAGQVEEIAIVSAPGRVLTRSALQDEVGWRS